MRQLCATMNDKNNHQEQHHQQKHFKSTLQSYTVLDGVKLGILTVTIISEASYAYYKFSIKTQFMKLSKLCGTVCH